MARHYLAASANWRGPFCGAPHDKSPAICGLHYTILRAVSEAGRLSSRLAILPRHWGPDFGNSHIKGSPQIENYPFALWGSEMSVDSRKLEDGCRMISGVCPSVFGLGWRTVLFQLLVSTVQLRCVGRPLVAAEGSRPPEASPGGGEHKLLGRPGLVVSSLIIGTFTVIKARAILLLTLLRTGY